MLWLEIYDMSWCTLYDFLYSMLLSNARLMKKEELYLSQIVLNLILSYHEQYAN